MFEAENFEEGTIELAPFGSFPVSSTKDIQNTALPEFESSRAIMDFNF